SGVKWQSCLVVAWWGAGRCRSAWRLLVSPARPCLGVAGAALGAQLVGDLVALGDDGAALGGGERGAGEGADLGGRGRAPAGEGARAVKERAPARERNRAGSPRRARICAAPIAPTPGAEVMMAAGSSSCSSDAIFRSRSRISAVRARARRASAAMSSARSG